MLSDHLARAALAADRWRCGLRAKFCMVGEQPWHYLEGGVGKRDTIVLLHGFGAAKITGRVSPVGCAQITT